MGALGKSVLLTNLCGGSVGFMETETLNLDLTPN